MKAGWTEYFFCKKCVAFVMMSLFGLVCRRFRFLYVGSFFSAGSFLQVERTKWAAKMASIFHTRLPDAELHAYYNYLSICKFTHLRCIS
jgi:hypothetical protein